MLSSQNLIPCSLTFCNFNPYLLFEFFNHSYIYNRYSHASITQHYLTTRFIDALCCNTKVNTAELRSQSTLPRSKVMERKPANGIAS